MEQVIRIPEKTVKKRRRLNMLGIVALALLAVLGGIMLLGGVITTLSVKVEYPEKMAAGDLEDLEYYYIDKLVVVDQYAVIEEYPSYSYSLTENGIITDRYMLAYFVDGTGTACYVSLSVDLRDYTQNEIADLCDAFVEDATRPAGDLTVSGCFRLQKLYEGGSAESHYTDAYQEYAPQIPGEKPCGI